MWGVEGSVKIKSQLFEGLKVWEVVEEEGEVEDSFNFKLHWLMVFHNNYSDDFCNFLI